MKSSIFPKEVFTPAVVEVIDDACASMGYPLEYLCSSMLVATATAMGNNWSLEVKAGWREKAILYMALVGNAGANKTHPMTFALAPLTALDLERIAKAYSQEVFKAPPRLVVSDVTQEGLVKLHQKNPRGLLLFIDELKAWVANFSRYSGGSQEQFWLSNFSRSPIIVDRKSDAQPITIANPAISVIGSTQPSVLRTFASGDRSTNGFVDRLLFVIKEGSSKAYWSEKESDLALSAVWEDILRKMVADPRVYQCKFTELAKEEATKWQKRNADLINTCVNERLIGHYSKLEIYFVRFCLILHALRHATMILPQSETIEAETVRKAVALTEYYRDQVIKAQDFLYPDIEAELSEKGKLLLASLPQNFTRSEAVKIAKGLGISKSPAYKYIKDFTGVYIDMAEDGSLYKLMED